MALDQAANFVVDELQSSVTDTATTFSVADASQFPDPANGGYNLVVFDATRPSKDPDVEVVRVTGRDTTNNDLTVSRGQETTTAVSHASGTAVELSYTAKFRDDIQTEIDNAGGSIDEKVIQDVVFAGHPDFNTAQDAIDFAETNGYARVYLPSGTYSSITVPRRMSIIGAAEGSFDFFGERATQIMADNSSQAVTTGDQVLLENIRVDNQGSGGSLLTGSENAIRKCRFSSKISLNSDSMITNSYINGTLELSESAAHSCVGTPESVNLTNEKERLVGCRFLVNDKISVDGGNSVVSSNALATATEIDLNSDYNSIVGNTFNLTITDNGSENQVVGNT